MKMTGFNLLGFEQQKRAHQSRFKCVFITFVVGSPVIPFLQKLKGLKDTNLGVLKGIFSYRNYFK